MHYHRLCAHFNILNHTVLYSASFYGKWREGLSPCVRVTLGFTKNLWVRLPTPLFTHANERGSMLLIRIPTPFVVYSSPFAETTSIYLFPPPPSHRLDLLLETLLEIQMSLRMICINWEMQVVVKLSYKMSNLDTIFIPIARHIFLSRVMPSSLLYPSYSTFSNSTKFFNAFQLCDFIIDSLQVWIVKRSKIDPY